MGYLSLYYRKKRPAANSIEEVFNTIESVIKKEVHVNHVELEHAGAGPLTLMKNILYARNRKSHVNHITGEVQYLVLGTGRNSVLTIHDVGSAFKVGVVKQFFIRILWFWIPSLIVKKFTVISEFSRQELIKILPWAKNKIVVIHNPVNSLILKQANHLIKSSPSGNNFKILHLGTKENKNLFRTIEAVSGLPIELQIIGELSSIEIEKLNKHQIKYSYTFNLPFNDVIEKYNNCDIVCFASTYEGFGMPIIEAQALGKPVVTSNVASMPEVAGDSAVLVDPYSVESIRKGIISLIDNKEFREDRIRAGYKNIERFKIECIAKQYLDVYREVFNAK